MEICPKCYSDKICFGPRQYGWKDVFAGGKFTEFVRMNSKWGLCNECRFHWRLSNSNEGYFLKPRKAPRLTDASFLALLGIILLFVGVFTATADDVVFWRWVLICVGGFLLAIGVLFIFRAIRKPSAMIS